MTDPRPPFQGDSSRGRLPRAEAHGLFLFSPFGRPKMSKPAGSMIRSCLGKARRLTFPGLKPWAVFRSSFGRLEYTQENVQTAGPKGPKTHSPAQVLLYFISAKIIVRRLNGRMAFVPEGHHDSSQARSAWNYEENSPPNGTIEPISA